MGDRVQRGREKVGARRRPDRSSHDDDDAVATGARIAPAKLTTGDVRELPPSTWTGAAPSKLTLADIGREAMSPEASLGYAEWMLAPERGWSKGVDRRAEPGAAELDEQGALASAFSFLEDARGGIPLPEALRARLAAELGADLSRVRIHTDDRAAQAAEVLRARAFTIGDDIYFAAGAYDPESDAGVQLIAHEVAHVAQQQRGGGSGRRGVSRPDDAHERQADEFADRFTRSRRPGTDPASLVERMRRDGQRGEIPFRAEMEERFGTSFDFVEAYTGDAARLACEAMSAVAFAVRGVVALADPSPQRETLMHELTHIVQMGGRGAKAPVSFAPGSLQVGASDSAQEHEARQVFVGAKVETAADPDVVHREDKPSEPVPKWSIDDARKRFEAYQKTLTKRKKGDRLVYGKPGTKYVRYKNTNTPSPFQRTDYVTAAKTLKSLTPDPSKLPDTELQKDLEAIGKANGGGVGSDGLVQVGGDAGKSWGWIDPGESPPSNVEWLLKAKYQHATDYEKFQLYCKVLAHCTSLTAKPKFTLGGDVECDFTDASEGEAITAGELSDARTAIRDAFKADTAYAIKDNQWALFMKEVKKSPTFPVGLQGDIFGEIVKRDIKATLGIEITKKEIKFLDPRLSPDVANRRADGMIDGNKLVDFKSGGTPGSPDATEDSKTLSQARDYARIIKFGILATNIATADQKGPYVQAVYVFGDKAMSKKWTPQLAKIFTEEGQDPATVLRVFPAADDFPELTLTANPTFHIPLKSKDAVDHHIANPMVHHPGIKITDIKAKTKSPGSSEIVSGKVTIDTDLGPAVQGKGKPTDITPEGTLGRIQAKLPDLKSSLGDVFKKGRIEADAQLIDGGVKGTITVNEGPSGIPNLVLKKSTVTATYVDGNLTVGGDIHLARGDGKIHGSVAVTWDGTNWGFKGRATVEKDVVKGLETFTAIVEYDAGKWTFGIDEFEYKTQIKAVKLTGKAYGLRYDVDKGDFSGFLQLDADLGVFGKASGSCEIAKNKIKKAELSYDSPEFKYPSDSEKPTFTGTIGGTVTYEDDKLSGKVRGTAKLNLPGLSKFTDGQGAGLALDGHIKQDGTYGGTIRTTTPITFGDHFKIPKIAATIEDDGSVTGEFSIEVHKFKYLKHAKLRFAIDKSGVTPLEVDVKGEITGDKFNGSLQATWSQEKGLTVTGKVSLKLKEGLVATGELTYSTETGKIDVTLGLEEITLLDKSISKKKLFGFNKQISLVNVYGIGVYLEIGFDLFFDLNFKLGFKPTLTLDDLDPETFEYKEIKAKVELPGALTASLTAEPKVGLGLYALSPSLLRGGGGLKVPITGKAELKPTGIFEIAYAPGGEVTGDAKLSMALMFGIKGEVKPYANIVLLDGAWEKEWNGDALASFTILEPKEIFKYELDLGGDMKKADPPVPDAPGPETAPAGRKLEPTKPEEKSVEGKGEAGQTKTAGEDPGGLPDEPFKMKSMLSGIMGKPQFAALKAMMEKAGAAWDAISGFFGKIVGVFKDFFKGLADGIGEIIDGFAKEGWGYLPTLIKKIVGPTAWEFIGPLIDKLGAVGEKLLALFEEEPPKSTADFFPWVLKMVKQLLNISWEGVTAMADAIWTIFSELPTLAKKLVTYMVQQGTIGARRHSYYVWRPWPASNYYFLACTEFKLFGTPFKDDGMITSPSSVLGVALWNVLDHFDIPVTDTWYDPDAKDDTRNRWA